jgi:hypothetical protein
MHSKLHTAPEKITYEESKGVLAVTKLEPRAANPKAQTGASSSHFFIPSTLKLKALQLQR